MTHQPMHLFQKKLKKLKNSTHFPVLANFYREQGYPKMAETVCKKGLQQNSQSTSGYTALGQAYFDQGQYTQALKALKRASDLDPNNLLALRCMGQIYIQIRDLPKALKIYKTILILYPNNEWAKKMTKQLNTLCFDRYRYFSSQSLSQIAKDLSQKEFLQRRVIRPLHKEKTSPVTPISDVLLQMSQKPSEKNTFPTSAKYQKEIQKKQLARLLRQFNPHPSHS